MNAAELRRLLDICGPVVAKELLERVLDDLMSIRTKLAEGAHGQNLPAITAQSHMLIAIAGTIGATGLQQKAQILHEWAHTDKHCERMIALAQDTARDLDALVLYIRAVSPTP